MITRVALPKVNTNIEEMTVTRWIKREGDAVRRKEPIVELTTEKASFELESPASGTLRKILAEEKSVLPIGYVIALVGGEADALPDVSAGNRRLMEQYQSGPARRPVEAPKPAEAAPADRGERVRATPAARRLAREKGVDLAAVAAAMQVDVVREISILKYLEKKA